MLFLSVCALGVSSIITQLTLMREFLSVFSGNEMIYGIILGSWLLLALYPMILKIFFILIYHSGSLFLLVPCFGLENQNE